MMLISPIVRHVDGKEVSKSIRAALSKVSNPANNLAAAVPSRKKARIFSKGPLITRTEAVR
jgi:hypothetical protein